jgi:hypothetical protein
MHFHRHSLGAIMVLAPLAGCSIAPPTEPLEGVAVSKVIDRIKQDLAKSSVANLRVGDGSLRACGDDRSHPFFLVRAADDPTVTVKLSTARAIDVTGDVGIAKLPVLSVLFSADTSYEAKRQETVEQDITFAVLRPKNGQGDPLPVAVPESKYSQLGTEINEAELGILGTDHGLLPCLRPTKLSVNVLVDVTRTTAVNGTVGFDLLYSITGKASRADELKNQIQVDLAYAKDTPAALNGQ